jgi:energy-coupling factor transporter ATP-binding protein EcfA2
VNTPETRPKSHESFTWRLIVSFGAAFFVGLVGTLAGLSIPRALMPWSFLLPASVALALLVRSGSALWQEATRRDDLATLAIALVSHAWDCGIKSGERPLRVLALSRTASGFVATAKLPRGLTVANLKQVEAHLAVAYEARQCVITPDSDRADLCTVDIFFSDPLSDSVDWISVTGRIGATVHGFALWRPETQPHVLIVGPTGSGKTTAQLGLVATLALDPSASFCFVDVKRTGWGRFRSGQRVVGVATEHIEALELLEKVHEEMMRRLAILESRGVDNREELASDVHFGPLYLVVDEVISLLAEDLPGEDTKDAKQRVRSSRAILANIARLGRQSAVHLILGCQRPDAIFFGAEFRDNVTARVALGAMSPSGREMIFGPEWRHLQMSGQAGRGYYQGQPSDPLTPLRLAVPFCEVWRVNQALGVLS